MGILCFQQNNRPSSAHAPRLLLNLITKKKTPYRSVLNALFQPPFFVCHEDSKRKGRDKYYTNRRKRDSVSCREKKKK